MHSRDDHLHGNPVVAAFRQDHVRVPLGRLDKLQVHRPHRREVLTDHVGHQAPTLDHVTLQPADETNVVRHVDIDLDVEEIAQPLVGKQQYAVHQHDRTRLHVHPARRSRVRRKVVGGLLDRLAARQLLQVRHQQVAVDRIGMVEVDLPALVEREVREILVVAVLVEKRGIHVHRPLDRARDGGLAGTGAADDADDQWTHALLPRPFDIQPQFIPPVKLKVLDPEAVRARGRERHFPGMGLTRRPVLEYQLVVDVHLHGVVGDRAQQVPSWREIDRCASLPSRHSPGESPSAAERTR